MAGSRTLKLSILADTADLVKGLKNAEDTSSTFGDKLGGAFKAVGVAAAAAGAAIGAMAIKAAIDGVKSAIEDEAAQANSQRLSRMSLRQPTHRSPASKNTFSKLHSRPESPTISFVRRSIDY